MTIAVVAYQCAQALSYDVLEHVVVEYPGLWASTGVPAWGPEMVTRRGVTNRLWYSRRASLWCGHRVFEDQEGGNTVIPLQPLRFCFGYWWVVAQIRKEPGVMGWAERSLFLPPTWLLEVAIFVSRCRAVQCWSIMRQRVIWCFFWVATNEYPDRELAAAVA